DQSDEVERQEFDAVAICTGSSPSTELVRLLGDSRTQVENRIGCSIADEKSVMRQIDATLARSGLNPRLYLPALAEFARGPGFANLSSLGTLSNCILSKSITTADAASRTLVAEAL